MKFRTSCSQVQSFDVKGACGESWKIFPDRHVGSLMSANIELDKT